MKRVMKCSGLFGVSLMALCVAAPQALAQTGPTAEDDRDQVVIVGQTIQETLPQELEKYGSDVEVTTIEEIRNAGFVDVAQALQMDTPGLFLAPRGGPFSYLDISLQGSRTQDILFLVDGIRVNNRLYSTTVTDTLPASMVERVEVLKGGQSLFYGTQANAGVINIVTRGYTDDFNGLATVGVDTNDSLHLDAYVRGKAGPGNYVIFASQDKSDGIETFTNVQPSATDRNRSYDVNEIGAKYRLNISDRLSLDGRYSYVEGRLDYPGVRQTAYSKNERTEDLASLALDWDAADWAELLVKGYWYKWDSTYTTINNRLPPATGQVVVDNDTFWGFEDYGLNALAKLTPHKGFEYLIGYDYQKYSGRDDVLVILPQKEEVNAVFAQVRTTPDLIQNLALAAGVRHDETSRSSKTVWNVSGRYDVTPNLYVQGLIGTSFILPTAEQLFAQDLFDPLGNPSLEPEESESINLSVGGQWEAGSAALQWQATYFDRTIENLISDDSFASVGLDPFVLYPSLADGDPDPDGTPRINNPALNPYYANGIFTNIEGEVDVTGFELLGSADFGNGFSLNASYTHNDTDVTRIPKDFAKAGASYASSSGRWGLDSHILWTGEQLSPNVNSFGVVNYGDYVVVDIAGHFFIDAAQKHKLVVRLENAFDEDYNTRVSSQLPDVGTTRFLFGNRGVPQTLHITYSYAF